MRLDKYLAHLQVGSRAEVKQLIKKKAVSVDGEVVRDPGFAVAEQSQVTVSGTVVAGNLAVTYLMNKPAGVITATEDPQARTVVDLIDAKDRRPGLFPVGRLDKDTTGLLLLTTDGALGHALLSPKRHVDKTYLATLNGALTADMVTQLEQGIVFKDFTSAPAQVTVVGERSAEITIHEGKFHQVKRMFHAVGIEVVSLKRLSMGALRLPEALPLGSYRALTEAEMTLLQE
ncbi:pseudouridine synthase [Lacticaseibacillus porcinae]|uniref:pseudouridine synthase n=1 Tax=Lacticaseibacillus porcinae TaxID=1123687 RepID=UPI000F77581F|nr:pseudouridine synthase [Lacticaseibacillus porcinae]